MSVIMGLDPGSSTGVAYFSDGKLQKLDTIEPVQLLWCIKNTMPARVIFEDSRLESHVWSATNGSRAAALKMARNVGEIDAWCKLIVAICAELGVAAHGISPKSKGAKLSAEQFKAETGWGSRCNQHERDAAMIAWPYKNSR